MCFKSLLMVVFSFFIFSLISLNAQIYLANSKIKRVLLLEELDLAKFDLEAINQDPELPFVYVDHKFIALTELVKEFICEKERSEHFNLLCKYFSQNYKVIPYHIALEVLEEEIQKIKNIDTACKKTDEDLLTKERISSLLLELIEYLKNIKMGQALFLNSNKTKHNNFKFLPEIQVIRNVICVS